MYLKSIEMQGFKSFADKIYLDFNPGVTAIVGPNGSGKSNISDAIRWVMGEQSIKTLRGGKMEDVIFSGTDERKPLGFAEVSLVIDNSTRIFPIDYSEICVLRRIYRSGESEYMINKAPCRLKDIHELFMDTGLGREGYSIIGQGKIDEILSNKSEDRRHIFEEAAGITKFKYRKAEAEKKLNETTENLTRVSDIMLGISEQIEPLKEQSEKAKKYLILRDELKEIDVNFSVNEVKNYKLELLETEKNISILSSDVDSVQGKIDISDNKINQMYDDIGKTEEDIDNLRILEKENIEKINECSNNINIISTNIDHENENILRIKNDIEKSKNSGKYLDSLLLEYQKRISEYETEKKSIESILKENEAEILEIEKKEKETENILNNLKTSIFNNKNNIIAYNEKISATESVASSLKQRKKDIFDEIENNNNEILAKNNIKDSLLKELTDKEAFLKSLKSNHEKISIEYEESLSKLKKLTNDKILIESEVNKNISKKAVLEEMEKEFEGYGKSVKLLMSAYNDNKLKNIVLHGPLSSLIHTEDKYITAIEVALQNANQNIVTDTEDDAKKAIKFLKDINGGRITFLPISIVRPRRPIKDLIEDKGYIGVASELVSCNKKYSDIVSSVLGATLVTDNIDNALIIAKNTEYKYTVVTLSGELIRPGGSITGGSLNKATGFLSRSKEIKELNKKIDDLKLKADNINNQFNDISDLTAKLFEKNSALTKELTSYNEMFVKEKAEFDNLNNNISLFEDTNKKLNDELDSIDLDLSETENNIKKFNEAICELENDISTFDQQLLNINNDFEGSNSIQEEKKKNLLDLQFKLNNVIKDIAFQNERYDDILTQMENAENVNSERENEIKDHFEKIAEFKEKIKSFEDEKEILLLSSEENSKKMEQLSFSKNNLNDDIRKLQNESKETREQLFSLKNQLSRIENKKFKIESNLDLIIDRLWEEYELTFSDAEILASKSDMTDLDESKIKKRIDQIKAAIKNLGNINIDSIEDYKAIKDKFDFLTNQTEDLNKSKEEMEKLIDELSHTMKKQFSEQFSNINKNFQIVFKELFGGGTAHLELSDPDNLLETGIEIEAQPPGKKLQRLSLLSGGERAFTAIALLFAILKVRPTPFCILDEIEAALDDVNVYRYADYLKKFSKKTQFIVVTHRRGTMESANVLYGVTMQERGVSKLLTLNIDEVAK